jgi:hypothetical protein
MSILHIASFNENKQINAEFLQKIRVIFNKVYLNANLPPATTTKCLSVYVCIGNKTLAEQVKSTNTYYHVFSYEELPQVDELICAIYRDVSFEISLNDTAQSVAVFDMDDTIIDENFELFYPSILTDIWSFREYFSYLVLWTHATEEYLHEVKQKIPLHKIFDLFIARKQDLDDPPIGNKGLAAVLKCLNKKFMVQNINYALLVDDKASNYNSDYNYFLYIDKDPKINVYRKAQKEIGQAIVNNTQHKIFVLSTIQS